MRRTGSQTKNAHGAATFKTYSNYACRPRVSQHHTLSKRAAASKQSQQRCAALKGSQPLEMGRNRFRIGSKTEEAVREGSTCVVIVVTCHKTCHHQSRLLPPAPDHTHPFAVFMKAILCCVLYKTQPPRSSHFFPIFLNFFFENPPQLKNTRRPRPSSIAADAVQGMRLSSGGD